MRPIGENRAVLRLMLLALALAIVLGAAACGDDDGGDDDADQSSVGPEPDSGADGEDGPAESDDPETDREAGDSTIDDSDDSDDSTDSTDSDAKDSGAEDSSDDEPDPPKATTGDLSLEWERCENLDCATFAVPFDDQNLPIETRAGYTPPDQVELAVVRAAATGPGERLGVLMVNPGGPGESGTRGLSVALSQIPAEIRARFDLVSFDPRGVGDSAGISCDVDFGSEATAATVPADDDAAWDAWMEASSGRVAGCSEEEFALGQVMGTNTVARDMEKLRVALGEDRLSYVGLGYGTRLGAVYADLFPTRVRGFVLDGGWSPDASVLELWTENSDGFDDALDIFAIKCDAAPSCPLSDTTMGSIETARQLVANQEVSDGGDGTLTAAELEIALRLGLTAPGAWPTLALGLQTLVSDQTGALLHQLVDFGRGLTPDGVQSNAPIARPFVLCADDDARPSPEEIRVVADAAAAASKHFADLTRAVPNCHGFGEALDPVAPPLASGSNPILVLGTSDSAAAPLAWSQAMVDSLDNAELFTIEGTGLTSYGVVPCVKSVVNEYLLDLIVPEPGSGCADTANPFA